MALAAKGHQVTYIIFGGGSAHAAGVYMVYVGRGGAAYFAAYPIGYGIAKVLQVYACMVFQELNSKYVEASIPIISPTKQMVSAGVRGRGLGSGLGVISFIW